MAKLINFVLFLALLFNVSLLTTNNINNNNNNNNNEKDFYVNPLYSGYFLSSIFFHMFY